MRTRRKSLVVLGFLLLLSGCSVWAQDLIFIHHSVGQDWLDRGLRDVLVGKSYIGSVNEITYGTPLTPDSGRPASLGDVPGDSTDMQHWVLWFNDYVSGIRSLDASPGFNRIVMFKSCFPNSDISSDGTEPGDPFSDDKTLANYRAVYRHPSGPGSVYESGGREYHALEDIFAAHPDILFIPVTAPPLSWGESSNANAHRARVFNDWLRTTWLASYNSAHPTLRNVTVFNLFDILAYSDSHSGHPNRLKQEYGGNSGDAHPNEAGDAALTEAFAAGPDSFIDQAWSAFNGAAACIYSINPTSRNHEAGGGDATVSVTSGAGCSWSAESNDDWILLSGAASGSGNGTVAYRVASNTGGSERTGTLAIAGHTFTINQAAAQQAPAGSLLFPAFFQGIQTHFSNSFVGVAVSNPSDSEVQLTASGLTPEGEVTTENQLFPLVPAYGQRAFLTSEAINPAGTVRTFAITAGLPIRGFFMVGENSLNRLDGVGDQWVRAQTLYFPLAKRDSLGDTTIYIHNPNDSATTVRLTWIGQDGKTISEALMTVLARGTMARPVGQLFPPSSATDGYLKVVSDVNLTGCLVYADPSTFVALPARPVGLVQTLYAPHFYVPAAGGGTELRLINTEAVTVSVRVRAFRDGHELLGDQSHNIPPGAIWVADLGTFLHLPLETLGEGQSYTGYLQLDIRTPVLYQPAWVVGAVVFSGNNRKFAAGLPLVEEGYTETLIPHVAQSDAFHVFTGLAVLNAGGQPADVTVLALNAAGEQSGSRDFTLQPGERAVDLLNGPVFFGPEFSQNGGYLRVSSTQPLVSFALFGDSGLEYMAAIGGQSMDQ